jgi:peptidoglycan/LPS O-acetylase OafA/YrhL
VGLAAYAGLVISHHNFGFSGRFAVVVASVLILVALTDGATPVLIRVFSSRPMRGVGKVSYGLYLWHIPALILSGYFVRKTGISRSARVPLALIGTGVATVLSYQFVERPFHRRKDRYSAPKSVEMATV